jgi:hypothetical protein
MNGNFPKVGDLVLVKDAGEYSAGVVEKADKDSGYFTMVSFGIGYELYADMCEWVKVEKDVFGQGD